MLELKTKIIEHGNSNTFAGLVYTWVAERMLAVANTFADYELIKQDGTDTIFLVAGVRFGVCVEAAAPYNCGFRFGTLASGTTNQYIDYAMARMKPASLNKFVISYFEAPGLFIITKVVMGNGNVPDELFTMQNGIGLISCEDEKFPLAIATIQNTKILNGIYGSVTDSWTDVPINGLMNSVMVWPAQYSIHTNPKVFRFKTGAMDFPALGQFGVSGVGDFIILQATKSGDIVSGLAYKL